MSLNKYTITLPVLAAMVTLAAWSLPAYAYLDPGTGSLIIQSIIGAIAAIGVTLKLYWHKIKLMLSGRKNKDTVEKRSDNTDQ